MHYDFKYALSLFQKIYVRFLVGKYSLLNLLHAFFTFLTLKGNKSY